MASCSCTLTKSTSLPVFSSSPVPVPRSDELHEQYRLPISSSQSALMVKCSVSSNSSTTTATVETKKVVAKPKVPSKAPAKQLPQLMEEDVIPSLRATFEAQDDLFDIQLTFQDNRLEGSFTKKDTCYSFWAFFPDGILTGARGFSLSSSYGSEVSTVEPFLVDEKKITAKHVVFWVEKRLAAQGILPVWLPSQNDSQ